MTPRERVNAAVRRQPVDRVPKEMGFVADSLAMVQERLGPGVSPADHFGWETRQLGFRGPVDPPDFSSYYAGLDNVVWERDYGTGHVAGGFHHFVKRVFPLETVTDLAAIEAYPWPDFTAPERHAHLEDEVARHHAAGYHVSGWIGHIWETGWQILGLERTLADLLLDPDIPAFVLGQIAAANCFKARRLAEAGVDLIRCGDDVGTQHSLMMSPELWRRMLKPLLAQEIAAAREVNPDIPVWYHSDGDISPLIADLVEVGVTVLNPLQPEAMDLAAIARDWGDQLAVWGTIGTQSTLPWGSPDDVREAVRHSIELFAPGLVLAPTHVIEPEVPWDNIVAFHDAIDTYGVFER